MDHLLLRSIWLLVMTVLGKEVRVDSTSGGGSILRAVAVREDGFIIAATSALSLKTGHGSSVNPNLTEHFTMSFRRTLIQET